MLTQTARLISGWLIVDKDKFTRISSDFVNQFMTVSCIVILYNCGQLNFILDKKMKATSSDGPNYKGDLLGHLKCSGDILIYIIIKYSSIPIFLFNVYI